MCEYLTQLHLTSGCETRALVYWHVCSVINTGSVEITIGIVRHFRCDPDKHSHQEEEEGGVRYRYRTKVRFLWWQQI